MSVLTKGFTTTPLAGVGLTLLLGAVLSIASDSAAAVERYEDPPRSLASEILPADLISGTNHQVQQQALSVRHQNT